MAAASDESYVILFDLVSLPIKALQDDIHEMLSQQS